MIELILWLKNELPVTLSNLFRIPFLLDNLKKLLSLISIVFRYASNIGHPFFERFSRFAPFLEGLSTILILLTPNTVSNVVGNNAMAATRYISLLNLTIRVLNLFGSLFYDELIKWKDYFFTSRPPPITHQPEPEVCRICQQLPVNAIRPCVHLFCHYCLATNLPYTCTECNHDINSLRVD